MASKNKIRVTLFVTIMAKNNIILRLVSSIKKIQNTSFSLDNF